MIDDQDDDFARRHRDSRQSGGGSDNAEMSIAIDFDLDTPMGAGGPGSCTSIRSRISRETGFPTPGTSTAFPARTSASSSSPIIFSASATPDDPVVLVWDREL